MDTEFDEQDREIIKEIKSANDHYQFLGKQISSHEVSSMLPYFDCEEPGHDGNALDQVCLEQECRNKGLCCVRCQYQRHRSHANAVYPLHTFVSQLVTQQAQRKLVLEEQVKKCAQYRDVVISIVREYLNGIIDHMTDMVAQMHKYYTTFENSYENVVLRSQIMVHSLLYKKHIRRDRFQRYVREGVRSVKFERADDQYKPSSDVYVLSQPRPQRLEDRFVSEQGGIIINDQERAYSMTGDYIGEMQKVATKLQQLTRRLLAELTDQGQLQSFSSKIPRFEKVADIEELQRIKEQFGVRIDNVFETKQNSGLVEIRNLNVTQSYQRNKPDVPTDVQLTSLTTSLAHQQRNAYNRLIAQGSASLSQIPSVPEYLSSEQSSSIIDPTRTKCTLGMLFETVGNCSILRQKSFRVLDVSCMSLLGQDAVAVGCRFQSSIDVYRLSDKKLLHRIETKSEQGVKYLLTLVNSADQSTLVVGLYFDGAATLSYRISTFQQTKTTINSTPHVSFNKPDPQSATTVLKELYQGEYFAAGYSTGTIATYHYDRSEPLNVVKHLYDGYVGGCTIIDPGRTYLTWSGDKCRFHYVSHLSNEKSVQNISPLKSLAQSTCAMQCTESLMEDRSALKLIHLMCGEVKDLVRVEGETREQGLRFMRVMKDDVKLTFVEEGALSNFREPGQMQNSVKEILLLEPRKRMSKLWAILIGENNRLQLWEIRRAMSQNIKLWEKELDDFLKPMNHNLVKCRLLCESQETTCVKYSDVGPKAQIVRVQENVHSGRFNVTVCIVNHHTSEIEIYDIELMSL